MEGGVLRLELLGIEGKLGGRKEGILGEVGSLYKGFI